MRDESLALINNIGLSGLDLRERQGRANREARQPQDGKPHTFKLLITLNAARRLTERTASLASFYPLHLVPA